MAKNLLGTIILSEIRYRYRVCKKSISVDVKIEVVNATKFSRIIFKTNMLFSHNSIGVSAYYESPVTKVCEYIVDLEYYLENI